MKILMEVKACLIAALFILLLNSCVRENYYLSRDGEGGKIVSSKYEVNIFCEKNGKCIDYALNGDTIGISYYKNGKLHGVYTTYFENGEIQNRCEFVNGNIEGVFVEYYDNGQLAYELEMKKGLVWNVKKVYDSTGTFLNYGKLRNGEGEVKVFSADGSVIAKGFYKNGLRYGWWMFYTNRGVIIDSVFYGRGVEIDYFGY